MEKSFYPEALWKKVREDYETSPITGEALAARYGIPRTTIGGRARNEGWRHPPKLRRPNVLRAADPASLVARLFRSFERQIADLEQRFADPSVLADERDARMLAVLAKTFETLEALKAEKHAGEGEADAEPVDLEKLRERLAADLAGLAAGGGGSGEAGGAAELF